MRIIIINNHLVVASQSYNASTNMRYKINVQIYKCCFGTRVWSFTEVLISSCIGSQSHSLKVKCVGENCSKVKLKFALEQVIKAKMGSRCVAVLFL